MMNAYRHFKRRRNAVRIKADLVVLLDRIAAMTDMPPYLRAEVAEMRMRAAPPTGIAAPVKLTNYTQIRGKKVTLSIIDDIDNGPVF